MPSSSRPTLGSFLPGLVWLCAALLPGIAGAGSALPQRNLWVELREADSGQAPAGAPGWSVRSADASIARERPAQQLRVLNGASASLRIGVSRSMQVWQVAPGAWLPAPVPTTQWIEAGQRLTVQPRWPGGREPVTVVIDAEASRIDAMVAPGSAELPQRAEARVRTSLRTPLGQWVTIAATGAGEDGGHTVSSAQAAAAAQRVLQLRVSLAP